MVKKIHKLKNKVAGNSKPFLISNKDKWTQIACKNLARNVLVTDKWSSVTCWNCLNKKLE